MEASKEAGRWRETTENSLEAAKNWREWALSQRGDQYAVFANCCHPEIDQLLPRPLDFQAKLNVSIFKQNPQVSSLCGLNKAQAKQIMSMG